MANVLEGHNRRIVGAKRVVAANQLALDVTAIVLAVLHRNPNVIVAAMRVSGPYGVAVLRPGLRLAHVLSPLVLGPGLGLARFLLLFRPGLGLARLLLVSAAGLLHLLAAAMSLGALSVLPTTTPAALLGTLRMLVATVATFLLGASGMTALVALAFSLLLLAVASAMRGRRRRGGNRQGSYTCGQEKPGHDKKLPSFQSFNEDVGWRVPAAKFTSSAMKRILAQ